VEADIWLQDGDLLVSHYGLLYAGSLRGLYLDPLQALVDRRGSVLGDGLPEYLWIDIKTNDPELRPLLRQQLSRYPMLRGPHPKVIAILTGEEEAKAAYMDAPGPPFASRDSNELHDGDPRGDAKWDWYSLDWQDLFDWDGRGSMPDHERAALHALVARIHRGGRRLRLWGTPDTEALWAELIDAEVDMLDTSDLPRMRRFLSPVLARVP
jgi:alkaline phosphatase